MLVGELLVKIKAEMEGTKEIKDFTSSLKGIVGTVAGLYGVKQAFDFLKSSVMAAEAESELLRKLAFTVNSVGESYQENEKRIKSWATALENNTRFSTEQAYEALNKLTRATGNLNMGLQLTDLAMDISSATGADLENTVNNLKLAYLGNERGILMLKKEFGAYLKDATTGKEILETLTNTFDGMKESEQTLTKNIEISKSVWSNFIKGIGEDFKPITSLFVSIGTGAIKVADTVLESFRFLLQNFVSLVFTSGKILKNVFTLDFEGMAETVNEFQNVSGLMLDKMLAKFKDLWGAEEKGTKDTEKKIAAIKASAAGESAKNNQKKIDEESDALKQFLDTRDSLEEKALNNTKRTAQNEFNYQMKLLDDEMAQMKQHNVDKSVMEEYYASRKKELLLKLNEETWQGMVDVAGSASSAMTSLGLASNSVLLKSAGAVMKGVQTVVQGIQTILMASSLWGIISGILGIVGGIADTSAYFRQLEDLEASNNAEIKAVADKAQEDANQKARDKAQEEYEQTYEYYVQQRDKGAAATAKDKAYETQYNLSHGLPPPTALGGIVFSPQVRSVAEREPELITPLSRIGEVISNIQQRGFATGGGRNVNLKMTIIDKRMSGTPYDKRKLSQELGNMFKAAGVKI